MAVRTRFGRAAHRSRLPAVVQLMVRLPSPLSSENAGISISEMFAAGSHHAVGADHETRGRLQRNAAGIFERLSGFEHRLLADNARAAYLLAPTMGIGDAPVARFQLHRLGAFIGDGDRVGPEEIIVLR